MGGYPNTPMVAKSRRILVGKGEICAYAGVGKNLFPELIEMGFPAVFWGGAWRAHADNVEGWMQKKLIPTRPQIDIADKDEGDDV